MKTYKFFVTATMGLLAIAALAPQCIAFRQAMHSDPHAHGVDARGDMAMGFSHEKTQHHFRLFKDGGSIDVVVKSAADVGQRETIRGHLKMIRDMFAAGDFHLPMFIHDRTVPGLLTMEAMKKSLTYSYSDLPLGGRVRIQTGSTKALAAIHKFLVFQVKDHRTGDSRKIESPWKRIR